jgi:hypothetical protein
VRKPTLYVLDVGVSTYRDDALMLKFPAKDAQDVCIGGSLTGCTAIPKPRSKSAIQAITAILPLLLFVSS